MTTVEKFTEAFVAAWRVSTPIVAVRTADASACIGLLVKSVPRSDLPIVRWDIVRGLQGLNKDGDKAVAAALAAMKLTPAQTVRPAVAMEVAGRLPGASQDGTTAGSIVFVMNAHRFYKDDGFVQAVWNLRDQFKADQRMVVLMDGGGPGVPIELKNDAIVLDEPLPAPERLAQIARGCFKAGGLNDPKDGIVEDVVDAVAGLSAFQAEQVVAMSLRKSGADMDLLWEHKRVQIEQTRGLSVWRGGQTFSTIGGNANVKAFLTQFAKGPYHPGCVLWIDEIEKMMAGVGGDLTGISDYYLGVMLAFIADHKIPAFLFMGHPGTGKSEVAKAWGNEIGKPTIRMDTGAMQASLVGESQANINHALKVVTAISRGKPVIIATCNSTAVLPAELMNRFAWRFFFDMPTREEKDVIWKIHAADVTAKNRPADDEWNGREIAQCATTAQYLGASVTEAAQYVVPIAVSGFEAIQRRREEASGRYISAARPGFYTLSEAAERRLTPEGLRKIDLSTAPFPAPGSKALN